MTRLILVLAALAIASLAVIGWFLHKFSLSAPLPVVEDDWCGIHGWTHVSGRPGCAHRKGIPDCAGSWEAEPEESQADTLSRILGGADR